MRKLLALFTLAVIVGGSLIGASMEPSINPKSNETVNQTKLAPCYHGTVGDSDSVFTVDYQDSNQVKGSMAFVFAQKDSSYGTYTGVFNGDTLKATYTFWSEGTQSEGDYYFSKSGENFVGNGYTYTPSTDCLNYIPAKYRLTVEL